MNLHTRPKEHPEVNLTSLIDVVFLLLIFFMVSTTFVKESEIAIRLPEAAATPRVQTLVETLEVTITAGGDYLVNGRALVNSRPVTLRNAIEQLAGETRDMPVTISADADARHQSVITAMDVVGRLGFTEVNIATRNAGD